MKKRILIIASGLRVGGVERSLIGLLEATDKNRYDVNLFLHEHDGEFMDMLPAGIRLLPENLAYASLIAPIKSVLFSKAFPVAVARLAAKFVTLFRDRVLGIRGFLLPRSVRYCLPFLPPIPGDYDLAISFLTPHDPVLNKVSAIKKIGWIHTDYSVMECGVDQSFERPMWQELDAIAAVSDSVRDTFVSVFPELSKKVFVVENIISPEFVRKQAETDVSVEMPEVPAEYRICSVGRFCHPKNFESIPEIVLKLHELGIGVRWYLIGFGGNEELIRSKIADHGVEEKLVVLGKKTNPYPYMHTCDIYVQPSRYEGKAVTVREAQILGKPVLITNFPTAKSQLEDGVDGFICPLSIDGVVGGIQRLIEDRELRARLAQTAASRDYSNQSEIKKVDRLIDTGSV